MNGTGKNYWKRLAVAVAGLLILAVAWHWGRPAYRQLKEQRSAAQAQAAFDKGDYRNAVLSAQLALLLDSNNVPACRVMAGLAEISRSPATLDWRQRIVELEPTVDNKLALASAGLEFQNPPFPLTSQLLNQLADTASNLTTFQSIATMLALKMNRMADADAHMAAAGRLEPTNRLFQLNLAVLRLNSTNPAVVNAALGTLRQFSTDTNLGPPALRSLVAQRLMHQDFAAARDYSTQLLAGAQANLDDHLQYLGILKHLDSPDLATQLKAVQQDAATNAVMAAQTAAWMQANGFTADTVTWLNALSTNVQTQTPVQLALVDYYLDTTNWQGLCRLTAKGDWGEMDFLRLAFLSHAWSELGESLVGDSQWNSAVNQAEDRLGALNALLELAGRWDKKSAQEDLLQRIVKRFPDATWAQQGLERLYMAAGDTQKLYQFYAGCLARSPQNPLLKNNLAATAMLLQTNLPQAFQWAAEIHAQYSNDPVIISTYAFALHLQGRDGEGVAAFQNLPPAQLNQPSVALYYGLLLAAAGERERASYFLTIAKMDGQMLPEEKQLLAKAMK